MARIYFFFARALMHLAQALTLLLFANFTHCKFGCFLFFVVGLYLLLSFFLTVTTTDFLLHISQILLMLFQLINELVLKLSYIYCFSK